MYKTIIMPVDVFEMELSDKAIRHAEFHFENIHWHDDCFVHKHSQIGRASCRERVCQYV